MRVGAPASIAVRGLEWARRSAAAWLLAALGGRPAEAQEDAAAAARLGEELDKKEAEEAEEAEKSSYASAMAMATAAGDGDVAEQEKMLARYAKTPPARCAATPAAPPPPVGERLGRPPVLPPDLATAIESASIFGGEPPPPSVLRAAANRPLRLLPAAGEDGRAWAKEQVERIAAQAQLEAQEQAASLVAKYIMQPLGPQRWDPICKAHPSDLT